MASFNGRLILLTGAPDSGTLSWAEHELNRELLSPFKRFLGSNSDLPPGPADKPGSGTAQNSITTAWKYDGPSGVHSAWRKLPLQTQHLSTGFSQGVPWHNFVYAAPSQPGEEGSSFTSNTSILTSSDLSRLSDTTSAISNTQTSGEASFSSGTDDDSSQFYDHSFAVHEDGASFRSSEEGSTLNDDDDDSDSDDTTSSGDSNSPVKPTTPQKASQRIEVGHITAISNIPGAAYLLSIVPQTMTVNIVASIVEIRPAVTVRTRRTGSEMNIIELLIGDDTKAGFGFNLWLPASATGAASHAPQSHQAQASRAPHNKLAAATRASAPFNSLAEALAQLREQDIILARNVALSAFRGRVYGQSLGRGVTRLELLHRPRPPPASRKGGRRDHGHFQPSELDRATEAGGDALACKVRRVRDWQLQFVGPAVPGPSSHYAQYPSTAAHSRQHAIARRHAREVLPDDTP